MELLNVLVDEIKKLGINLTHYLNFSIVLLIENINIDISLLTTSLVKWRAYHMPLNTRPNGDGKITFEQQWQSSTEYTAQIKIPAMLDINVSIDEDNELVIRTETPALDTSSSLFEAIRFNSISAS